MTANRKAELQRKLALAPVPKPPEGLADRIKSEIPNELLVDAEKERARLRQAVAFNIRVAASIILLVSSVFLALQLLSRKFERATPAATVASNTATASALPAVPEPLPTTPPPAVATPTIDEERKKSEIAATRPEPVITRARAKKSEIAEGAAPIVAAAPAFEPAPAPAVAPAPPEADAVQEYSRAAAAPAAAAMKTAAATLDVEASAAPFDATKQILRVSLDGPHQTAADVAFNDDTVASWHTIAADGTSMYEMTLRPQALSGDVLATVRLNGSERVIRRADLHAWEKASRRMKAASLAAALEAGVPPKDVAAKARAAGLDDLAAAAEARERR